MSVLSFGKHKGKALSDVPRDYLRWMAHKMDDKWGSLAREVLGNNIDCGMGRTKNEVFSSSTLGLQECLVALRSCSSLDEARRLFDRLTPSIAALPASATFLLNQSVKMFGRLGGVEEAIQIFDQGYDHKDNVSWSMMFKALVDNERWEEAELLFKRMPPGVPSVICCTIMISFYASRGLIDDAKAAFDRITNGDVQSWNALLSGYVKSGRIREAKHVFNLMSMWDAVSWNSLPFEFDDSESSSTAIKLRFDAAQSPKSVGSYNRLLLGFARCGDRLGADAVFHKMPARTVVSFTGMIMVHAENHDAEKCRALFSAQEEGRDAILWTTLLQVYANTGNLREAHDLFLRMPQHDAVACIKVSFLYARHGWLEETKQVFDNVPSRDPRIWTSLLLANANLGQFCESQRTFRLMPQWDGASSACAIAAHRRSGDVELAEEIFRSCQEHCVISWNVMLEVYAWNSFAKALHFLQRMPTTNEATLTMILSSPLVMPRVAKNVFDDFPGHSNFSWTCLIAAYARQGRIKEAADFLTIAPMWDLPMLTSLMSGLCKDGRILDALEIFQLLSLEGILPEDATFSCLLDGFSHTAKLKLARTMFHSMLFDFGIEPTCAHYTSMIDLLGRAGYLDYAEELAESMPFIPDVVVWQALLGSCRNHKDSARATRVMRRVLHLDPMRASAHVLAANTLSEEGEFGVEMIREAMINKGIKRVPGVSLVQIGNEVHRFIVGDASHPQIKEINEKLESLSSVMKEAGYRPDTSVTMIQGSEQDKEDLLCRHSEKLALGFALIATAPGSKVEIRKNLRMCYDCHDATAFLSRIVNRKIVVRDANRLHRFENGICSCAGLR